MKAIGKRNKLFCAILSFLIAFSCVNISACSFWSLTSSDLEKTNQSESGMTEATETTPEDTRIEDAIEILDNIDFQILEKIVTSDYLSMYYTLDDPGKLGLEEPAPTFGEFSYEDHVENIEETKEYLEQLMQIDPEELPFDYQILYDVLVYDMEEFLLFEDFYYLESPFNSITGVQSGLPLTLAQFEFSDRQDVENYLLLVSDIYRYYGEMMDFERERADLGLAVADVYLDKLIENCESMLSDREDHFLVTGFADRLDNVSDLTEQEKEDYIEQHEQVLDEYLFPAYELLIEGFSELKGRNVNEGGVCGFDGGIAYYKAYFQVRIGSDMSVKRAISYLEDQIEVYYDEMFSVDITSDLLDQWEQYDFSKGTVKENIDYCIAFIEEDFPALPDHDLILETVPSQLEDFFSPAAYFTCKIDDPTRNVIITNEATLENEPALLETCAHEGYPGHLFENVYHAGNISNYYQRTASFISYSEGWAEYSAGFVMKNAGFDEDLITVDSANSMINKLLVTRVDIGINYEGWEKSDVKNFLNDFGMGYDEFVDWCWDISIEIPCYYAPYCFGHLMTKEIMEEAAEELGDTVTMQEIHTAYLDIGAAPFPIIEKYMEEFVNNA